MRRRAAALLLVGGALTAPVAAVGQGWRVDVGAGHATHDPVAARVATVNASAGVRFADDGGRWLILSGGVPLDGRGPGWGTAGAGGEWTLLGGPRLSLGLRGSLDAFGYGATDSLRAGGGALVAAAPTVSLARGPLSLELHAGALTVSERLDGETLDPRTFADAGARMGWEVVPEVELAAEGRWLHGADGGFPYAGASAGVRRAWGAAWAHAGRWLGDGLPMPRAAFGAGASVRVGWASEVEVGWQQQPSDPVYLNAPRRTWSVQLSRALGPGARARRRVPVPVVPPMEGGRVVLALAAVDGEAAPSVLGDFTEWQPVRMTRDGGRWTVALDVPPGTYHYGFRDAAGEWFLPPTVPVVDDGMGGTSAVLVVP